MKPKFRILQNSDYNEIQMIRLGSKLRDQGNTLAASDVENWIATLLQSEHVSLLIGSGLTNAISFMLKASSQTMSSHKIGGKYADHIENHAAEVAKISGRGTPNIEDTYRSALQLLAGLQISDANEATNFKKDLDSEFRNFLLGVIQGEAEIMAKLSTSSEDAQQCIELVQSFLLSFACRPVGKERLNVFTTNYDRVFEFFADGLGLRLVDRFVGYLEPTFRTTRIDIDYHYNPPGIRGEPRFLEGVVKFAKLHGSLDWRFSNDIVRRVGLPFGAEAGHPAIPKEVLESVMIYPNAAKDRETLDFPYVDLFRDFSAAVARPNSVLFTYGYGFGDDHINRAIRDMLRLSSSHLVVISFDDPGDRIINFSKGVPESRISLLVGDEVGDLKGLVSRYLPLSNLETLLLRDHQRSQASLKIDLNTPSISPLPSNGTALN